LARDSCLPLLMLCEKVIVPQLSLSAYRIVYCGYGESACKAVHVSGRLLVPRFAFDILRPGFNNIIITCLYVCCFIVIL
jgi:phosphoheptose isomerase